jgi:alkanesulfonate monooxygenase SsuD/methylene tetrahydromethanopterin reductase-like flavin-dependent oxidoreductase (luciferase family)
MDVYRRGVEARGSAYSASRVGVARAVTVVDSLQERTAFMKARAEFAMQAGLVTEGAEGLTHAETAIAMAEQGAIIGERDEVVAKLRRLEAAGVRYVLLADRSESRDALRRFARDVMPEFQPFREATAA